MPWNANAFLLLRVSFSQKGEWSRIKLDLGERPYPISLIKFNIWPSGESTNHQYLPCASLQSSGTHSNFERIRREQDDSAKGTKHKHDVPLNLSKYPSSFNHSSVFSIHLHPFPVLRAFFFIFWELNILKFVFSLIFLTTFHYSTLD